MEGRSRTWEGQAGQMSVGVTGTSGSPSGLVWCREQRRALSGLLPAHKGLELQTPQLDVGVGVVWAQGTSSLPSLGLLGPWPGLCFKPDSCPRAKYPLMCLFWCGLENRLISQLPISVTIGMRFYRESVALWAVLETFSSFFAYNKVHKLVPLEMRHR